MLRLISRQPHRLAKADKASVFHSPVTRLVRVYNVAVYINFEANIANFACVCGCDSLLASFVPGITVRCSLFSSCCILKKGVLDLSI